VSELHRLKVVHIRPELIADWLRIGRVPEMVLLTEKLPEDAVVVAADFNRWTGLFLLVVHSAEFDLVPVELGKIPPLEPPVWGVKQEACNDDPDSREEASEASRRPGA